MIKRISKAEKGRREAIFNWFRENMKNAQSELSYDNPFQLIIAVILSAQCTDKRVNMYTPAIFKRFPTPESLAGSSVEEIYSYISSISFPNNKAKHLKGLGEMLVSKFNSQIPDNVKDLEQLPGVGRKTANVVASIIFGAPVIAVDTHVFRVAHRLEFSQGKTPLDVEEDLTRIIPECDRADAHHWLILHGRYVCTARNPKCASCGISDYCRSKLLR
jgi:endonuclease III